MNLGNLIHECEARSGFKDSTFQSRWRQFINAGVRAFARRYPWPGLEAEVTLTLNSGNRFLALPHYVDQVTDILNVTDRLPVTRRGEWSKQATTAFANLTQGRPLEYDLAGEVPTIQDPVGFIWFRSSQASDVNSLYITGTAAVSGASDPALFNSVRTLSVTAQGTTPVTLSTQFVEVHSVAKATSTNGDFFFMDAGDSNKIISFISAADQEAKFRRLQFLFVPSGDKSLRIKYTRQIPLLTDDTQSPHPTVKDDYVIEKALALFARYQTQYTKGTFHDREAEDQVANEANKEQNFGEPFSTYLPEIPGTEDPESDWYRGGY